MPYPISCSLIFTGSAVSLQRLFLLTVHQHILQYNSSARLRIITAGVKIFIRQDSQNRTDIPCKWRIPSDGLSAVVPYVGEGVVRDMGPGGMGVLRILVEFPYPMVSAIFAILTAVSYLQQHQHACTPSPHLFHNPSPFPLLLRSALHGFAARTTCRCRSQTRLLPAFTCCVNAKMTQEAGAELRPDRRVPTTPARMGRARRDGEHDPALPCGYDERGAVSQLCNRYCIRVSRFDKWAGGWMR